MRGAASGSRVGWVPGACGAAGFAAIVGSMAYSASGYPGYSPVLNYVSELALPHNPLASVLNAGFVVGGLLAAAFLVTLAVRGDDRAVRRAAGFGAIGALGLVGVGWYPVTDGAVHFYAAGIAMLFSFIGSMNLFATPRRPPVFSILLVIQLACVVGAAAYLVFDLATKDQFSLASRVDIGTVVNPYCIFEWGFVGTVALLLFGVSAAELARATSPALLSRRGTSRSRPSS